MPQPERFPDFISQIFKKLCERRYAIINCSVRQILSFQAPAPFFNIRWQNRFRRFSAEIKKSKTAFDLSLRMSSLRFKEELTVLVSQLSTTEFTSRLTEKSSEFEI
jgi:hypothetical protein